MDKIQSDIANRIPPELVREIALQGQDHQNGDRAPAGINIPMGGVCKHWRDCIYRDASLWCWIDITEGFTWRSMDCQLSLSLYFDLSKDRPLDVRLRFTDDFNETTRFWDLGGVSQHIHRIRSMHITNLERELYQKDSREVSLWQKLTINTPSLRFYSISDLVDNFHTSSFPQFSMRVIWDSANSCVKVQFDIRPYGKEVSFMKCYLWYLGWKVSREHLRGTNSETGTLTERPTQMDDELLQIIENIDVDSDPVALKDSGVVSVLQGIADPPSFPADDIYNFQSRATRLAQKFEEILRKST